MDTSDAVAVERHTAPLPAPAPARASFLPAANEYQFMQLVAEQLAATEFVPRAIRGRREAVLACMLTGREMGIGPMRALRQIDVIDGKAAPSPELLMARILDAGHYIRVSVATNDRCVVRTRRRDWPDDEPTAEVEWTLDDAVQAELVEIKNGRPWAKSSKGKSLPWMTYTRAMLRSRCVGEAARMVHPDITEGASYAPEELTQGRAFTQEQGQAALEGLPDDVREQVEEAMEPVYEVVRRADGLRDAHVITGEQHAKAIAHAHRGPRYVQAVEDRLDELEDEYGAGGGVVDGEVVDDGHAADDDPAEGLTDADYGRLGEYGFTEGVELSALALWASDGRTAATLDLTGSERTLAMAAAQLTAAGSHEFKIPDGGEAGTLWEANGDGRALVADDVAELLDEAKAG